MPNDRDAARLQHVGGILARTAARHPTREAIVWKDRRQTYAELNRSVNSVASSLAGRGVHKGDRVALLSHNCRGFLLVYLALAKLGAISVPINFMSRPEDVSYILGHAQAIGLVVEDGLVPVASAACGRLDDPGTIRVRGCIADDGRDVPPGWDDVAAWEAGGDSSEPAVPIADDDPLQLMYTSGTESRPKGVALSSRSLVSQFVSCIIDGGMAADDVDIHALPFYHCAQLHCFFGPDMYLGAAGVILPGPDPEVILRTIERERANKLFAPPTVWIALLRSEEFDAHDLSSLRKGYYGAAAMPVEVLGELSRRLPGVSLWNFYGQTEMAPAATVLGPADQSRKPGSAGKACINVETKVVDTQGADVRTGEVGEIVHRSPHAMVGYWDDPDRTAEAFRGGWFHSGDLGYLDDEGYLYVVDRKKDMIKTGGENVACREVEELYFGHPAVAEVAVFGIPHPYWIEAVTVAVTPRPGSTVTPDELVAFGRERLASYKAPKFAVVVDSLPKNPSGKILKRVLREELAHLATTS